MSTGSPPTKRKWPVGRTIALSVLLLVLLAGIFLYRNLNQLLTNALNQSFNKSVISDVYELTFDDLDVNVLNGSIRVEQVSLAPRATPLKEYGYINSSFSLATQTLLLEGVEIRTLLRDKRLVVTNVLIDNPEIEFLLNEKRHIMLPFKDKSNDSTESTGTDKRPLESFGLKKFAIRNATFHSLNTFKAREFNIQGLDFNILGLSIAENQGEYSASFNAVQLGIAQTKGFLKKGGISSLGFEDFELRFDSGQARLTLDTVIYGFQDIHSKLSNMTIQTKDSLYHLALKSFQLSYKNQQIQLNEVSFTPNVTHAVIQKQFQYQHTEFSGQVASMELNRFNFDSLIYGGKLQIDKVELDGVKAKIFKDKTKPLDTMRFPVYLGQSIREIKLPLQIGKVTATNVVLDNTERKPDSTLANVTLTKARVEIENLTNLPTRKPLRLHANAAINDKVRFKANLAFSYSKSEFSFDGQIDTFRLADLNPLIQAYTPASIKEGIADEITFAGIANEKNASGSMRFLYHNLEVDLNLQHQARWKSSIIAFVANTVLNSHNPHYPGAVPREVKFHIERDPNKGFVNVIIKSILNGLKETMIMNKENRKSNKEAKNKK